MATKKKSSKKSAATARQGFNPAKLARLDELLGELHEAMMDRTGIPDLNNAVKAQAKCRQIADMLKGVKTAAENRHRWLAEGQVPSRMEELEITKVTVQGVGRVNLKSDIYVRIPAAKRDEAMKWFEKHSPDLISETINSSSLKAHIKARIEKGDELPESVTVTPYTLAIITAG
jgi:hypothetical protein